MVKSLFEEDVKNGIISDYNQEVVENKSEDETPVFSGSFIIIGDKRIADIRLEFDATHPKYRQYLRRLQLFVKSAEKEHVLFSYSGI